ncbi:MAG: glycogen synthase GlgA [Rhodocyclaceae bacterium]|nr:glycogen synthase GlgA [Rhodocyclaceae bacterium]
MNVLFATPEIAPWVKTGGLGDVAGALPLALRQAGCDVRLLVPRYPAMQTAFPDAELLVHLPSMGGNLPAADLYAAQHADGLPFLLLDCPLLFDRPGNPYLGPEGLDWLDNHLRFGLLSRVAARLAGAATPLDWQPDILHCHDWQTGLAPYYLRHYERGEKGGAATVMTIHNLAFQGVFPPQLLDELGLFASDWSIEGVEYYGYLSFLKAGLRHADALTTVSPTYAREIQTEAEGMGMQGLLQTRAAQLTGILNGIDTEVWNPARDPHLAANYDFDHLAAKRKNKAALQREMGLAVRDDCPLFGVVSRLTTQKGLDLVAEIGELLVALPAQLAVLGSGDKVLEAAFLDLAARHPDKVAVVIGFNEPLAHRIEAGADCFLMPSRFEPCGLNQMYSLAYGTPPLVRATGGLADTVVDYSVAGLADGSANGFVCGAATPEAILATAHRATDLWHDKKRWRQLQRNALAGDYSWRGPAQRYLELFRSLRPA